MNKIKFILISRFFSIIIAIGLIGYIIFVNTLPFGANAHYSNTDNSVSALSPNTRVTTETIDSITITKQKDDLVYFSTKYPFTFDTARIKLTYKNPDPEQQIELGFKDRSEWHYATQIVDTPLFNSIGWTTVGTNPVLFQRGADFASVESFLKNMPSGEIIGTIDYSFPLATSTIADYSPANKKTLIDTPLRGRHVMYAYLDNEPFELTVHKQDLNWYDDPDVMDIKVYKDNDLVFRTIIDDDGITDSSRTTSPDIEAEIKNPGPGLPESGVYKIVFDCSADVVIKSIETNLNKVVFESPVYPISNSDVYPEIVDRTVQTALYTNSKAMTAVSFHGTGLQKILVNKKSTTLASTSIPAIIRTTATTSDIILPKSDVIISGMGYYAFAKDQFFLPAQNITLNISSPTDLDLVDYILTPYTRPIRQPDGYYVAERQFDVRSAAPDKGKLSWIIKAPGLKENGGEVIIKDIEVTYTKTGWWQNKNTKDE